jgi:hypothetical protein
LLGAKPTSATKRLLTQRGKKGFQRFLLDVGPHKIIIDSGLNGEYCDGLAGLKIKPVEIEPSARLVDCWYYCWYLIFEAVIILI